VRESQRGRGTGDLELMRETVRELKKEAQVILG
jgi:hypothetical protein